VLLIVYTCIIFHTMKKRKFKWNLKFISSHWHHMFSQRYCPQWWPYICRVVCRNVIEVLMSMPAPSCFLFIILCCDNSVTKQHLITQRIADLL
jgi:hypothetical protein